MRIFYLNFTFALFMVFSVAASNDISEKEALDFVDTVQAIFHYRYAPYEWKKNTYQWDLDHEIEKVKQEICRTPQLTIKSFHKSLKGFFNSLKDYHVKVRFYSTEESSLPFQVKGVDGRYYVSYVDLEKLSSETFPITVGDELVSFGGRNPGDVIHELLSDITPTATLETDHSLAERCLTHRRGEKGEPVPKGAIIIKLLSHETEKPYAYQLMWDYKPEMVFDRQLSRHEALFVPRFLDKEKMNQERALPYFSPSCKATVDPNELGERDSFLPYLGEVIWSTDSDNTFHAYLYKEKSGRIVGCVRIPHYMFDKEQVDEFQDIIDVMREKAEVLVIDQLNNRGGNLFVLYAFASMLTDQPLETPKEHIQISQDDVMEAYQMLDTLEIIQTDEQAQALMQDIFCGYPMSYQAGLFLKEYCRFIQDQWLEGKLYTDLTHLYGIDYVNPHPRTRYTGPIILLINELDFSCGDFFPAIMKDNNRAILVGKRTAGAGGYVTYHQITNRLGVHGFSITGSLGIRSNQQPIENLGITPDIENHLIAEDMANGYQHYQSKIHEVVESLLPPLQTNEESTPDHSCRSEEFLGKK